MSRKTEEFGKELNLIGDAERRLFVSRCLENVADYFFEVPASSTGKYHPKYSLGRGGLVRHTKAAVHIADDLLRLDMFSGLLPIKDAIISALILHDTCKSGRHGFENHGFTMSTHPLIACDLIKACANDAAAEGERPGPINGADYCDLVCDLISTHMGQWREDYKSKKVVLPEMKTKEQKFVHLCDYLASRKDITVTNEDGTPLEPQKE